MYIYIYMYVCLYACISLCVLGARQDCFSGHRGGFRAVQPHAEDPTDIAELFVNALVSERFLVNEKS